MEEIRELLGLEPEDYPEADVFDICEAYYLYLSFWHLGQGSDEYRKLSQLTGHFNPRDSLRDEDDLSEVAREIYDRLCDENGVEQEEVSDA